MYDFIGDIHGEYDSLVNLLEKLEYKKINGVYQHKTRIAYFLGDLIDRGPKVKETLDQVIAMTSLGKAKCIMGNHEFNLICFFIKSRTNPEVYLRDQNERHIKQCKNTLDQIKDSELNHYLDWMKALPFFEEQNNFRAVHAAWDNPQIKILASILENKKLTDQKICQLFEDSKANLAMEITLKGYELELPIGVQYCDHEGNIRKRARFCWWDDSQVIMNKLDVSDEVLLKSCPHKVYKKDEKPVFFGHYWLKGKPSPFITASNAQCLDFSVAREGHLAAYRFNGESVLTVDHLSYV